MQITDNQLITIYPIFISRITTGKLLSGITFFKNFLRFDFLFIPILTLANSSINYNETIRNNNHILVRIKM